MFLRKRNWQTVLNSWLPVVTIACVTTCLFYAETPTDTGAIVFAIYWHALVTTP